MSKKKAVDFELRQLHRNRNYWIFDFIDKKGRTMMSSVDVIINSHYYIEYDESSGVYNWDYEKLNGFVRSR